MKFIMGLRGCSKSGTFSQFEKHDIMSIFWQRAYNLRVRRVCFEMGIIPKIVQRWFGINQNAPQQTFINREFVHDCFEAVDRPLFQDFWQRFLDSMDALKIKKQRTVYRLTLVKTWNMQEVADYAALVARGMPSFIEIKGVTFCGKSDGYVTFT